MAHSHSSANRRLQREARMMKLERLIAGRESISIKPVGVPLEELLAHYEKLYTGALTSTRPRALPLTGT